jgi:hypothetical protein
MPKNNLEEKTSKYEPKELIEFYSTEPRKKTSSLIKSSKLIK